MAGFGLDDSDLDEFVETSDDDEVISAKNSHAVHLESPRTVRYASTYTCVAGIYYCDTPLWL